MIAAAQQAAEDGVEPSSESGADEAEKPRLNTPLAGMLPPELASVDVTTIFPEFRPGKVKFCLADGRIGRCYVSLTNRASYWVGVADGCVNFKAELALEAGSL